MRRRGEKHNLLVAARLLKGIITVLAMLCMGSALFLTLLLTPVVELVAADLLVDALGKHFQLK
jgi:hypothetical protein